MRVGLALSSSSNDLRNFLWIGIFASPTESRPKSSSFWSLNSSCVSTSNSGKSSLIATQPTGRPSKRTPFVNDSSYTEIIYIYIIDCPLDFWREEPSVELIGILEIHLACPFDWQVRLSPFLLDLVWTAFPLLVSASLSSHLLDEYALSSQSLSLPGKPKIEPETHRSFQSEFYPTMGDWKSHFRFHSTVGSE